MRIFRQVHQPFLLEKVLLSPHIYLAKYVSENNIMRIHQNEKIHMIFINFMHFSISHTLTYSLEPSLFFCDQHLTRIIRINKTHV